MRRALHYLMWGMVFWPGWALLVFGAAVVAPDLRVYLFPPLLVLVSLASLRIGMLFERYALPELRKVADKPWVPINTVVLDVAKEIESALAHPVKRWLYRGLGGEIDVDYVKLADLAVDAAARSAVRRKRHAVVEKLLDG